MAKSGFFTVKGTDGDNSLVMPSGRNLLNTAFDGGRGNDTLDLSGYSSAGVFVSIEYGFAKAKSTVAETPFTGTFGQFTLAGVPRAEGTLRNIENLIGTSGDDYLFVHTSPGAAKRVDGGPGDDVVNQLGGNGTLIGGTGSDWLVSYWNNNVLYGGEQDALAGSDGVRDYFYLGSAPTIMDFEVGVDHILIELSSSDTIAPYYSGAAEWRSDGSGSSLYVNGVREVTLANVDPATAQQNILFGVVVSPINNEVWGGPGDDMLYAGGQTTVTRVLVGQGDDIVVNFTLTLDTLVFAAGVTPEWSNTVINGAPGLVATFDGGSVTFQGLSMDDVGSMTIEGSRGTLSGSEAPVQSAWSLPSDFPPPPEPQLQAAGDWLI